MLWAAAPDALPQTQAEHTPKVPECTWVDAHRDESHDCMHLQSKMAPLLISPAPCCGETMDSSLAAALDGRSALQHTRTWRDRCSLFESRGCNS